VGRLSSRLAIPLGIPRTFQAFARTLLSVDHVPAREDVRQRAARWRRGLLIASVAAFWAAWGLVAGNPAGAAAGPSPQATPVSSGFFDDAGEQASNLGPPTSSGATQGPVLRSRGS
jgi:hypothetical protein